VAGGAVERRAPPYPVHALDTLAPGDAWHGAFTSLALAEGNDIAHSAGFANVAAAIKCSLRVAAACPAVRDAAMNSLKSNS
jgi:sulfofructose kinase